MQISSFFTAFKVAWRSWRGLRMIAGELAWIRSLPIEVVNKLRVPIKKPCNPILPRRVHPSPPPLIALPPPPSPLPPPPSPSLVALPPGSPHSTPNQNLINSSSKIYSLLSLSIIPKSLHPFIIHISFPPPPHTHLDSAGSGRELPPSLSLSSTSSPFPLSVIARPLESCANWPAPNRSDFTSSAHLQQSETVEMFHITNTKFFSVPRKSVGICLRSKSYAGQRRAGLVSRYSTLTVLGGSGFV